MGHEFKTSVETADSVESKDSVESRILEVKKAINIINSKDNEHLAQNLDISIDHNVNLNPFREKIIEALKDVYDPEIPTNIYDLGLIYSLDISSEKEVYIQMTLTSPACPVAQTFPQMVQERVLKVSEVAQVSVELIWEPPWTKDRMSEVAKLQLNMF